MKRSSKAYRSDREGGTVVLVAVTLATLVAVLALGIDFGMLADARSQAQRAADSGALAGASAFLDYPAEDAPEPARERAIEVTTKNYIRSDTISEPEVAIHVNVDSATVTVAVRREGVPTWFARLLGRSEVPISATATAQASDAGTAQCLKPFAVPDLWEETQEDLNGNRIWDDGERWHYDPGSDRYSGYTGPGGSAMETGYGSHWRDPFIDAVGNRYHRDYGRRIMVKATNPRDAYVPSFFYPWVLPLDENQAECGETGNPGRGRGGRGRSDNAGGGGRGAAAYRRNICSCNASVIDLDTEYLIEPGNMVGPTYQGLRSLIDADPRAYWDAGENSVVSEYGNDSPRVITVALFHPGEVTRGGRQYIRFNNFARFFIEEQVSRQDPVVGRFMYYVASTGGSSDTGTRTGSLVKRIRLIR